MKNDKHPIDDLFQRGLNQHSVPPPMHIWERIEENRGSRHRGKLVVLRQKFTILSSAAAVLLLGVWLGWSDTPDLGSFPLITSAATAIAQQSPQAEASLDLPARQAGLLPDVGAIIKHNQKKNTDLTPTSPAAAVAKAPVNNSEEIQLKGIEEVAIAQPEEPSTPLASATDNAAEPIRERSKVASLPAALENTGAKYLPTALSTLDAAPLPVPETGCARFSEGRPAIFLALASGPVLPGREFASRSDEYLDYAQQRSETESPQLSYGASARLSLVFPWGGAIRSGVRYTQLQEQLIYKNSKVRQTTITEIYGPNGEVIGTDTSYIIENTTLKYNNRYRLIDIPFQLGYEVRYNKITLAANAGVNLNVAYASKGNYLGPRDLLPTRFDSSDPDLEPVYKTKIGLSWQASLGLHYQLNDRLDFMAEPYLLYYPDSFTRSDYPLTQKYVAGGIGLGLRVLL